MGTDKAFVELGGKPLVEWVLDALEPLTRSFVLVVNEPRKFRAYEGRARVVVDERPHAGPLPALLTGLRACRDDWAFASTCDAPFLQPLFVQALAHYARGHDAAVPGSRAERWPLTAFYHKRCIPAVGRAVEAGDQRIVSFFPDVRVRWVAAGDLRTADPRLDSLWNLNTRAELELARARLRDSPRAA